MKSAERLNKFKEKFHPDAIFVVGDGGLKAKEFLANQSVGVVISFQSTAVLMANIIASPTKATSASR